MLLLYICSPCRLSPSDLPQHRSPRSSMHDTRYRRHSQGSSDDMEDQDDDVFMSNQRHSAHLRSPVDPYLSEDEARVMRRATRVMMYVYSFTSSQIHLCDRLSFPCMDHSPLKSHMSPHNSE